MATSYFLVSPFAGEDFKHAITENDFTTLKKAREFLLEYMNFEESVLQLLYATEEFEAFLLTTGLNHYLFPVYENDLLQDTRLRANLKVQAFLNSVTSLRDKFPKFKMLLPGLDLRPQFIDLWQQAKQRSVTFAFCERFRNYAQHQTQPVSGVTSGGGWNKERSLLESRISLFATITDVCINRAIPAAECKQYQAAFGSDCDISLIFRETVGIVGGIVATIRGSSEIAFARELKVYEDTLEIVKRYSDSTLVAADVVHEDGVNSVEEFRIFQEFADRVRRLRRTYLKTNNDKHFISNKARGHR